MCRNKQLQAEGKVKTGLSYNKKISDKALVKKKAKSEALKPYFEHHIKQLETGKFSCENCDKKIWANVCHIAHIYPKRFDILVGADLNNFMYLCDGCHSKFDRIQATSQVYLMNCFPIAHQRFQLFKDKISKYNKYVEILENYAS
jgi:Zn finger protein HypA/HybF involved in hydrogenase expression